MLSSRLVDPSRPIYTSGLIYQIYTNILYVLEYKSNMKIALKAVAACRVANWAEKHEPEWLKPSQMQPIS